MSIESSRKPRCVPLFLTTILVAAAPAVADDALRAMAAGIFGRLEVPVVSRASNPEAVLGRALFWDARISRDGKTACASCHAADRWGADARRFPIDARGLPTTRRSPTVFNSMSQASLRWLGDRKTGADQAESSITGSLGFDSKDLAVAKLRELQYTAAFTLAFPNEPQPLSAQNYGRALAAYQATLVTPAAFDRFLGGDDGALDAKQQRGMRAFIATGCSACHSGALFGGASFQRFGIVKDYWLETGSDKRDVGRYAITKKEEDRYVFRVPMLRNVAKTAPYFHDGSVATLDRAVRVMAAVQLGRTLEDDAASDIVAFLESLTGEVPGHYAPPE